jgi:hypothetical protein
MCHPPGSRRRRNVGISPCLRSRRGSMPSYPRSSLLGTHPWAVERVASGDAYRRNHLSHEGFCETTRYGIEGSAAL